MSVDIFSCISRVKGLYQDFDVNPESWDSAIRELISAIDSVSSSDVLERCVLEDENWGIPVDERIFILRKAKDLGASSVEFLTDYYGYLSAHLDPGVEWDEAERALARILKLKE